ncbi:MAG TPA: redox-sensing transcriptional repressor Rex [Oceanithermus profundus]|uniref:Redox-sensing transcriptional repressor Rex n=1 Tax=Oceanithermus profundus TaxID=187137 RepID=A0A7C4ZFT8_9DEIN|nr:redox-sensing transcriptional repressor Rex [Oceanithermus profundus]
MAKVPDATITRLVQYLRALERMEEAGTVRTSSEELARATGVTAFQVRKDLAYFGSYGTRGVGYTVPVLRRELRQILGMGRRWRLIFVGMGRLGQALADYPILAESYELVAGFDVKPELVGQQVGPVKVRPMEELETTVREEHVDVALLAVPESQAVRVANRLVKAGVRGILNFAPVVLNLPEEVAVENVDFMAGLSRLGFFMLNPRWREEMMG